MWTFAQFRMSGRLRAVADTGSGGIISQQRVAASSLNLPSNLAPKDSRKRHGTAAEWHNNLHHRRDRCHKVDGRLNLHRAKIRALRMLAVVVATFALSWLPFYATYPTQKIHRGHERAPRIEDRTLLRSFFSSAPAFARRDKILLNR